MAVDRLYSGGGQAFLIVVTGYVNNYGKKTSHPLPRRNLSRNAQG